MGRSAVSIRCRHIPRTELVADYLAGESLTSLRARYRVSIVRLRRVLDRLGVVRRDRLCGLRRQRQRQREALHERPLGRMPADDAVRAYGQGATLREMGERCGLCPEQVSRRLRAIGVVMRPSTEESRRARARLARERATKG